jgi:hypothetical protein
MLHNKLHNHEKRKKEGGGDCDEATKRQPFLFVIFHRVAPLGKVTSTQPMPGE